MVLCMTPPQRRPLSLDPEADRVPGPAEEAGLLDAIHHDQRHFDDRRARRGRDLERADALALGERRDERIAALDLGLELAAFALGNADEHRAGGAEPGLALLALPYHRRDDRLAVVEQTHRIQGLEAPVEEL